MCIMLPHQPACLAENACTCEAAMSGFKPPPEPQISGPGTCSCSSFKFCSFAAVNAARSLLPTGASTLRQPSTKQPSTSPDLVMSRHPSKYALRPAGFRTVQQRVL